MLKAVIFDFDYTLGDSSEGIIQCINYALETMGHGKRTDDDIKKTIGHHLTKAYVMLTGRENLDEGQHFMDLFIEKANEVMVAHTKLYPGVKKTLERLKAQGLVLAIVTTKNHNRIVDILEKFECGNLIGLIVGGDDVKAAKPDPEGLLWAIERLGLNKSEILYVGDSLVDAKTAETAEVDFAAVLTGTTEKEEFNQYKCKYICDNVSVLYDEIGDK